MGDAGEGLVDAEDRFQQRLAELEQDRQRKGKATENPERVRALNSLHLAQAELRRQESVTQNAVRLAQIRQALAEIEKKLTQL